MKKQIYFYWILGILVFTACQEKRTVLKIENPLPVEFGDPYILKIFDGKYYMVGTGGVEDGFKMYSSSNLKNWKDEGRIYRGNTDDSWGIGAFWAPELYEYNGKFYFFLVQTDVKTQPMSWKISVLE